MAPLARVRTLSKARRAQIDPFRPFGLFLGMSPPIAKAAVRLAQVRREPNIDRSIRVREN